ncbi:GntR family transcriptional regulator [Acuticoccus sediminis]|uniref:GntR family transcriptional regulator n=1 Tax=Acuticoccus sediminis TaxID=2184697 RepID=A0A8B2P017_9HYPH|nr:GntR family transcriptional regulator [Acuticoccus sediminis]RAI01607.1 GntR family transcriptional regulator [Acuticoccus sediminis]
MPALNEIVTPLRKETLQDGVHRKLCELILHGGLAPGQSITVASLASAFGVSPMPVREALTRLTAAGALTVVSGRTIGIPRLTRERLDDLTRVRLEVEQAAARWAAERSDAAMIETLRAALGRLQDAEQGGEVALYLRANYDFHFTVYRHAGSELMLGIIENLWLQISPYFHMLQSSGNYRISNHQHEAMLDALEAHDPVGAAGALAADIHAAYGTLVETLGLLD